jgi:hypothetical protein
MVAGDSMNRPVAAGAQSVTTIDLGQILDDGRWTGFQKLVLFLASITVVRMVSTIRSSVSSCPR